MERRISIGGHGWNRRLFYSHRQEYREALLPGGACMVERILGAAAQPSAPLSNPRCEHLRLRGVKGRDGLYVADHAGWTQGEAAIAPPDGELAVIWDEGLGGIPALPEAARVLWASQSTLPSPEQLAPIRDRCVLMLDVEVLRRSGAMISRQVSWEHSATDLVWQLRNNPSIRYLSGAKHLLILFAEDGAVWITNDPAGPKPVLVLADGDAEGFSRETAPGGMPDTWSYLVAQAAYDYGRLTDESGRVPAIYAMLKGAQRLLGEGYLPELLESGDFGGWLDREPGLEDGYGYPIPVYDSSMGADPHYWCIRGGNAAKKRYDVAYEYVTEGKKAIAGLPRLTFGHLTTVDRREIEAYQNIKNLIVEYAAGTASRPLSIAVFGAPGSGKSFGVTQIAGNVLPGRVVKLEFNVSQFVGGEDLSAAFHRVRDVILEGKLPLVFFDEFDSDRDGRSLGWLKSFLMPMQDGKFRDESGEHPVGRCIIVFAGGTAASFEEFCGPMESEEPSKQVVFKNVKGPDFISRLRGTINVLGPNPVGEEDQNYILRRALLLRSLCERKLPPAAGRMPISDDVLRTMLLIPRYKHGARSMEAILDMSRISGTTWEPASLPFRTQLALHVDADAFIRLVLNEVRLSSYMEKLAKAIHADYTKLQRERGERDPYGELPWEELPEHIRESNRRQARSITVKLRAVGCAYDAGDTPYPSIEEFTQEEILLLAQVEHNNWLTERSDKGYVYNEIRNESDSPLLEEKTGKVIAPPWSHPSMVTWEKLPESERQKDIDTVTRMIPLLKEVGLRVYRMI